MKVTTKEQAWAEVNKIFPTDYEKDEGLSEQAGYDIYRHLTLNNYNRICDLGCRIEVFMGEYGETVTTIWIEEESSKESNESTSTFLTEDEFAVEAGKVYKPETLKEVYSILSEMVKAGKISAAEVYKYARYKWCLRSPDAIVAYQTGRDKWIVNNCDTKISEDEAKVAVNKEWGFEASRIEIIGTPYYTATDYQYIRFNCAHMAWLWHNGDLCQVYA